MQVQVECMRKIHLPQKCIPNVESTPPASRCASPVTTVAESCVETLVDDVSIVQFDIKGIINFQMATTLIYE